MTQRTYTVELEDTQGTKTINEREEFTLESAAAQCFINQAACAIDLMQLTGERLGKMKQQRAAEITRYRALRELMPGYPVELKIRRFVVRISVRDVIKGLPVSIYRAADAQDCTNGGLTSRVSRAVLVGPDLPQLVEASEEQPALFLDTSEVAGRPYAKAVMHPVGSKENTAYMFGGNFVYTSDSRGPRVPTPVHDRREW